MSLVPSPTPWDDRAMLIVDLLEENDRLRARVADLESNVVWYVAIIKAALRELHERYLDGVWAREHRRGGVDDDGFLADEREWAA